MNKAKIRSCIVIFYYGGPSHLDTFDMKPKAPSEVRGEFKAISTSVPGLHISEHLPHTAKVMQHVAVVRSMHHTNRLHDSASTETLTGRQAPQGDREEFARIRQFFPCYGAMLSYMRNRHQQFAEQMNAGNEFDVETASRRHNQQTLRNRQTVVPHAALPWVFRTVVDVPCQGGGFLGAAYDPFCINGDPGTLRYNAEMFSRSDDLSLQRISDRRVLLDEIESRSGFGAVPQTSQLEVLYQKAFDLIESETVREALDVRREPRQTRERYGLSGEGSRGSGNGAAKAYGRNLRGQNLLLARRLVEAGVPFINVYDFKQQG
ncbi:MAG: DUF1501 domain-containing protein, partial [Pseudomonadales bacterium]